MKLKAWFKTISLVVYGGCMLPVLGADSLSEVWAFAEENDPRILANQLRIDAGEAELDALRRVRWPELELLAEGDFGQRARPGEERSEGVSSRGFLLARLEWALLDSGRSLERRVAALRRDVSLEEGAAYAQALQAEIARMYIGASIARERYALLSDAHATFEKIAKAAKLRREAGVDPIGATERIIREGSTWRQTLQENALTAETQALQLALIANRETVSPHALTLQSVPARTDEESVSPSIERLLAESESLRASAAYLAREDRWRLEAIAQTGPYLSQAFDDGVEEEYFAGLRLVWRPDVAGVQRQRARAETRRADAVEQESIALRRDYNLQEETAWHVFRDFPQQISDWEAALAVAQQAFRAAWTRWEEGVGEWESVLDEQERLLAVALDEMAWREQMALLFVEYAQMESRLDELPQWIGQK